VKGENNGCVLCAVDAFVFRFEHFVSLVSVGGTKMIENWIVGAITVALIDSLGGCSNGISTRGEWFACRV
jgi:hypothetical protein